MSSYLTSCSYLAFREGPSRDDRYPDALDPARLVLDGRRPEDLLVYAQRYAAHLRYFDLDKKEEETSAESWESFFTSGLVALAAGMATHDIDKVKRKFDQLSELFQKEKEQADFHDMARFVLAQYRQIDKWYAAVDSDDHLVRRLALTIRSYLAEEMVKLNEMTAWWRKHTAGTESPLFRSDDLFFIDRDDIWTLSGGMYTGKGSPSYAGAEEQRMVEDAMLLRGAFATVSSVTADLVSEARAYFARDIFQGQDHPPHLALFLSFTHLFGFVQERFNRLPQRIIDFYYRDVLCIPLQKAISDEGFIIFEPVKGSDPSLVAKGTAFTAGRDRINRDLVYRTTRDTVVSMARVQALHSVHIRKDGPLLLDYHTNIVTAAGKTGKVAEWSNRPFGGRDMGEKKDVGVAIASRQLYLSRGERRITITLILRKTPAFEEYPLSLLELQFTGDSGWLSSDNEKDRISILSLQKDAGNPNGPDSLKLSCMISIAQSSAIVAYDKTLHGGDYPVSLPVMQLLLKLPVEPAAESTPEEIALYKDYVAKANDLQSLQLAAAGIRVDVGTIDMKTNFDGVRDLKLENHDAPLDYKKPFFPFTALPKVGSSFYIGCTDLFYKSVEKFTINIEWMVPDNFRTYYQRYFPPYDLNNFTASLDILHDKKWYEARDVLLIDTLESNGRFNHFFVDMDKVHAEAAGSKSREVTKYETEKQNYTVKLKLLYPDFGHEIYPQLVTSAIIEKSQRKSHEDFHEKIKEKLHDSISIKLRSDEEIKNSQRGAWLSAVIYEGLKLKDEERARISMTEGLSEAIAEHNKVVYDIGEINDLMEGNKVIVNDDTFLSRVVGFLKRLKLLSAGVSVDRDKQDIGDVTGNIQGYLNKKGSHIIPSDKELSVLIVTQVKSVINQLAFRVVDELLEEKHKGMPDGGKVLEVLRKAVDEANETINDSIAGKIAMLLSASEIPPKPYTPLINTLSVNYISDKVLRPGEDRFFQVLPYGIAETNPLAPRKDLFPSALLSAQGSKEAPSGILFIGLSDLKAPQTLTLFFRMVEGPGHNDQKTAPLQWWSLRTDGWAPFKAEDVLSDGTYGFQTTGIVELAVPADTPSSRILFDEKGLAWLGVSTTGEVDAYPDLVDVKAQAAEVRFEDNDNDPQHLAQRLPPGSISRAVDSLPGIKKVSQPVATRNGKVVEEGREYYTRVSERLRHKQRAITPWDYEHLVLEEFPFVYKVKCLSNYLMGRIAPGHVTIVPIVDMINTGNTDNTARVPKANFLDLQRIRQYLGKYVSPFVRLHVINPDIQFVQVKAVVKLLDAKDPGYYLKKLNQDIVEYLTPWASVGNTHAFAAKVYPSSLYGFINRLDYVDFVSLMEMYQYSETAAGERKYEKSNDRRSLPETRLPMAHSIIVPSPEHDIKLL